MFRHVTNARVNTESIQRTWLSKGVEQLNSWWDKIKFKDSFLVKWVKKKPSAIVEKYDEFLARVAIDYMGEDEVMDHRLQRLAIDSEKEVRSIESLRDVGVRNFFQSIFSAVRYMTHWLYKK